MKKGLLLAITLFAAPITSFAQSGPNTTYLTNLIGSVLGIISALVPVVIGLAVLVFLWGIFKFLTSQGEDKKNAKDVMLWGIVAIFVMVSLWGLVNLVNNILLPGADPGAPPAPEIPL